MVLDLAVIGILLFSAFVAFLRGFVREVLTIFGLLGASAAALTFGPRLAPVTRGWLVDPDAKTPQKLFDVIPYDMLGTALGYALVFLGVLIALSLVSHLISKTVHMVGLGPVDRSLGVVFGLIRGVILIGLLYLPFHLVLSEEQKNAWFADSKTYVYVTYTAELMQAFLPGKDIAADLKGHKPPSLPDPLKSFTSEPERRDLQEKLQKSIEVPKAIVKDQMEKLIDRDDPKPQPARNGDHE